ncbi:MAG: hypothetical protein ACLRQF_14530 [Thomasclavelia ramosa]
MKNISIFIAVVMCLSLSTNIYAINDNEHEITTDKPHIILTPNQAGDELTVKLHLSQKCLNVNYNDIYLLIRQNQFKNIKCIMLDEGLKS